MIQINIKLFLFDFSFTAVCGAIVSQAMLNSKSSVNSLKFTNRNMRFFPINDTIVIIVE
jgi:hypothetical protein